MVLLESMSQMANPYLDVVCWLIGGHGLQQLLFLHQLRLQQLDVVLIFVDLRERLVQVADLAVDVLIEFVQSVDHMPVFVVEVLLAREFSPEVHLETRRRGIFGEEKKMLFMKRLTG